MKMQRTFPRLNGTLSIVCFFFKIHLLLYRKSYNSFTRTDKRATAALDQWLSKYKARKHCNHMHFYHKKNNTFSPWFHTRNKPRSSCSYLRLLPNGRRRRRESLCLLLLTKCCTVLLVHIILFCLQPGGCPQPGVPPARPPWTDLRSLQACGRITRPPSLTRDRVSPQDITQRGSTRSAQ